MVEEEAERWKRNYAELLQELRVAQTGNQILFAFLLALAFTPRFGQATSLERVVYVITLLSTTVATALIVAPVSHHRLTFRRGLKPEVARLASSLALVGMMFVLIALVGSVFLAVEVVVGMRWAIGLGAAAAAMFAGLWFVLPVLRWRWANDAGPDLDPATYEPDPGRPGPGHE